jgi:hypothetical protein
LSYDRSSAWSQFSESLTCLIALNPFPPVYTRQIHLAHTALSDTTSIGR